MIEKGQLGDKTKGGFYKKVGKAALGKPKSSRVHKDYVKIRGEYQRAGKRLAKMTGHAWKTRRS